MTRVRNKEREQAIRELYRKDKNKSRIARLLGISRKAVYNALRRV